MASSESEQATGFVERGTACYSTGISGDASWPAGHNAQEVVSALSGVPRTESSHNEKQLRPRHFR